MNFDFSDEQRLLREQARQFLDAEGALRRARRVLETSASYDRDLWQQIAALGWTGTTIAENRGGLGLGKLELCVIAEELGRSLAPVPFSSSLYLAAEALALAASPEQQSAWLPLLANGTAIGTFAITEGRQTPTPANLRTRFERGRLNGVKTAVPDGEVAHCAVVLARVTDHEAGWFLVDLSAPGVRRRNVDVIDPSRGHAEIVFDDVEAQRVGETADGWTLTARLFDRAAVLFAFEQLGGAQACLDMAVAWAKERYAFGRAIGSFQAIKHKLADLFVAIELARSHAYYGAWALAGGAPELPVAAAGARIAATEAFTLAARETIQTLGGMGFTWENDAHLYLRRARLLALNLGSVRSWREGLMRQLDTPGRIEQ